MSRLVDGLDPPIVAAEAEQVERTRRKGLVTGPIRSFSALQATPCVSVACSKRPALAAFRGGSPASYSPASNSTGFQDHFVGVLRRHVLGGLLGHDLVAEVQALGALAHTGVAPCKALPPELADRRPVGGDDHPGDVLPPFAAETASRLGFPFRSQSSPPVGPHFVFGNHLVGEVDAPLADEHARAGH